MISKKEAKKLYEGKFFYEIVKITSGRNAGTIQLFGPFDNILYTVGAESRDTLSGFAQVVDGKAVAFFKQEEILVTDRKL